MRTLYVTVYEEICMYKGGNLQVGSIASSSNLNPVTRPGLGVFRTFVSESFRLFDDEHIFANVLDSTSSMTCSSIMSSIRSTSANTVASRLNPYSMTAGVPAVDPKNPFCVGRQFDAIKCVNLDTG